MKHSKGPWHFSTYRETEKAPGIDIRNKWNQTVCTVHYDRSELEPLECKANSKLIAAAPDLLKACKKLVAFIDYVGETRDESVPIARAAIAKAEGA